MWPFRKTETRIATSDPFLGEFLGARWTARADIEKASGLAVAHRAVQTIAENLAAMPLKVYREAENDDRQPAKDHPLYGVLHDNFNERLTAFEGREMLNASMLIHGNAYARVERNGRGQVTALHPLVAGSVTVEVLKSGRLRYKHALPDGGTETLLQHEVLHLRYRTADGVLGMSPIQIAASTFGLAVAQQDQAGAAAENAFRPAGALIFPDKLAATGKENVITKFRERFVGALKANEVLILDGGAKFETFQFSAKDSEFLESRKLSNLDIARVFGVPPSIVGITDNSTYSNAEAESRALVMRCLAPMARRIEQALNSALLSPEARKSFLIEHDMSGLLRGDLVTRYNAYRIGREGGWLNVNTIRAFENLSNIGPEGETYVQPLNMGALGGANDNRSKLDDAA
ncbi:phage portal protein [Sinorhizobium meliloti]|uniref:phage portal protein n=1 Tax=Rhizobium meliloti TaxID=382 RepID=UPI00299E60AA|nr:phage portal protein [Sinorhizobium meliloti]MDW9694997.1 phage portal protein [Sinorhizobium meliloti]MDW9719812.1 phage portal protein [Sinorhizobium meliloti]MDW9757066.1 phage portal protein [Sinorhizobium meliloti]